MQLFQNLMQPLQRLSLVLVEAKGQMLPQGPGYIELVPEETHDTMAVSAMLRWNVEMREYLKANTLD